jgi:hypothetical protein
LSLAAILKAVVEVLQECDVPCMLTGSLAGAYYALPRSTQDVDLVLDVTVEQLRDLVQRFRARGLYVSETAAEEALRTRGQFNVIDARAGWKVDLIIRKDRAFSVEEFSRRRPAMVVGVNVALATPEDLILVKLEWGRLGDSDRQRTDVLQLVEARWDTLDREYVRTWATQLGLRAEWESILQQVSASRGNPG